MNSLQTGLDLFGGCYTRLCIDKTLQEEWISQMLQSDFRLVISLYMTTFKIQKIWTPTDFAVMTLKFEQGGFAIEYGIQKMQTEWQTM